MKGPITSALCTLAYAGAAIAQSFPTCQIADRVEVPPWEIHAGYSCPEDVQTPKPEAVDVAMIEGGGGLMFLQTGIGEVDLTGGYSFWEILDDAGIDLPARLGSVYLRPSLTIRTSGGTSYRAEAWPGFYSEIQDVGSDDIYVPFCLSVIQSFNPSFSGLLGVQVSPGFQRTYDPRLGVRVAPSESAFIDIMYPESRIVWSSYDGWELQVGVKIDQPEEFSLPEDDLRKAIIYTETRTYVAIVQPLVSGLRMVYRAGVASGRSYDFEQGYGDVDQDSGYVLSIGLTGSL